MSSIPFRVMNERFAQQAFTKEGAYKAAEAMTGPLMTHVREGCLMNKVWPMVTPDASKIQRDVDDPTQVYVLDDIEPDWVCMAMNADGMPEGHFYAAEAVQTFFYPIRSKEENITQDRVRHLTYSIEDFFKKHIGNEVARQRDIQFLAALQAATDPTSGTGQQVTVTSAIPTKKDLLATIDQIDSNIYAEVMGEHIIMHYSFLNKLLESNNDEFNLGTWEIFKDGYTSTTMLGKTLHLTRKKHWPTNKVYVVSAKEYVATNYEDYALKFQAEVDIDELTMKAKASMGHTIYNAYAIAELVWTEA